jgi:hypothetical protein
LNGKVNPKNWHHRYDNQLKDTVKLGIYGNKAPRPKPKTCKDWYED